MMKIKKVFLVFCLLGAGFTFLSAQNTEKAQKWIVYQDWWSPVFCDGEYVNDVIGTLKIHFIVRLDDAGNIVWELDNVKGTVTDRYGEQYKYKEHHAVTDWANSVCEYTYHIFGDRGTKYRGTLYWDFSEGWDPAGIIPGKTFCR